MHGFYAIGIASIIAPKMSHIEWSAWSANRWTRAVKTVMSIAGIIYLRLDLVRGPGRLPRDDAARVLVDQLAVAIPGCAVSDARVFERAAEATFTLMGTSAGRLYAVALVKLRRAGAPRYVGILRWMSASGRKRTSFDDLLH